MQIKHLRIPGLLALVQLLAAPAYADVDLRVEAWPRSGPIRALARVTDGDGSITGLAAEDFFVTLDGGPAVTFSLGLPPDQDPAQYASVVFVLENGGFANAIRMAVTDFINGMDVGDYAAVVSTRYSIDPDINVPVVQPFMQIDGGTGTSTLIDQVMIASRPGYPKMFAALMRAMDQFESPPVALPAGPRAIIVVGTGRPQLSYATQSDVVARANELGIPLFTIEIGDNSMDPPSTARMRSLAADTGGAHFLAPDQTAIAGAYATTAALLRQAYGLLIPQAAVTDCGLHMLEITALGQSASKAFARCDSTPQNFHFTDVNNAQAGALVVSDTVTISGIESPAAIDVIGGSYSIGCSSTFTSGSGFLAPGDAVCVRHTASATPQLSTSTLLMVGGVSSWFTSTTAAATPPPPPPPDGGNGGGGALGLVEFLLAFGALIARRRYGLRSVAHTRDVAGLLP